MTRPIRINCASRTEIPSIPKIREILSSDHHLVLQFPRLRSADMQRIIGELTTAMSECAVFCSGSDQATDWITVMPVVDTSLVLSHTQDAKLAVDAYIETCTSLQRKYSDGTLSPDWSTDEHGEHRLFENLVTGRVVEAPFTCPLLPEQVDPYFFALFVKSTHAYANVAKLIKHDFHDAARILKLILSIDRGM